MILVYVETSAAEGISEVSLETITFARDLSAAGNGVPIDAVVVGHAPEDLATELASYGVRMIHHASGDDFDLFSGAATATAVIAARQKAGSVVVMAGGRFLTEGAPDDIARDPAVVDAYLGGIA